MRQKGGLTTERMASELGREFSSVENRLRYLVQIRRIEPMKQKDRAALRGQEVDRSQFGLTVKSMLKAAQEIRDIRYIDEDYTPLGVTCKYPECHYTAVKRFALVPLCAYHERGIRTETMDYYNGKIGFVRREEYHKIMNRVPWRNKFHEEEGLDNDGTEI
jgi:hypothetical protein